MRFLTIILSTLLLSISSLHAEQTNPRVKFETSEGNIIIELNMASAPISVANFLNYVKTGFYDGTIFHRVINNFMIQGGGFTPEMDRKKGNAPVKNEADNGLKNIRGSIAMARTPDPHSASSQFFINVADNAFLDFKNKTPRGWGYAVFGQVVKGMNVVDKIKVQRTGPNGPLPSDVPLKMILIQKVTVLNDMPKKTDKNTTK